MEQKGPNVIILPYPLQGHINPMLQFGKRLASKGLTVTLVNSRFISKSMNINPLFNNLINLETISDGFDEGGILADSTESYYETFRAVGSESLSSLIQKLQHSGNSVAAVIYDAFLPWALDVAKKLGLVGVAFFTQTCAVSYFYYHVYRGVVSVPLLGAVDSVPGLPLLHVSETPSFVSDHQKYPAFYNLLVSQFTNVDQADWILHASFLEMEEQGQQFHQMYLDKRIDNDKNYGISLFKPNFSDCANWLSNKPKGSVVYIAFGSLAKLNTEQMEELAFGLKASNHHFLWVVREPEQSKLLAGFTQEVSKKGLVVAWCHQLDVLANEAIGCFVTHCGFNSVVEAMSLGVPMVAVPQWSDQPMNAKYVEDVWRVGVRARVDENGVLRRESLVGCIREVMEGESGEEIKKNAGKWKELARLAMEEGGSSDRNIDEFVAGLVGFSLV